MSGSMHIMVCNSTEARGIADDRAIKGESAIQLGEWLTKASAQQ